MPLFGRKKNWDEEYDEFYADRNRERRVTGHVRVWPHLLAIIFIGAMFTAAVGVVSGQTMFEKTLTSLASPCGILWLVLLMLIYFSLLFRKKWPAIAGLFCWLLLTVFGNGYVANWIVSTLEQPYMDVDPLKLEPFDTIFVLGGGTGSRINGTSQLTWHGDRISTAARMYHAGLVKQIICTGTQSFRTTEKDRHPREEAAQILEELNVPLDVILQMRGDNTNDELDNIKLWLDENADGHVGILTSAWHLPRAMRLANSKGIQNIDAIPANFLTGPFVQSPNLLIPSSRNLEVTRIAIKEYLAGIVGR